MAIDRDEHLSTLRSLLDREDFDAAVKELSSLHPVDIADLFELLEEFEKKELFRRLPLEAASEVIAHLSEFSQEQIVADLSQRRLRQIVDRLDSDDAADLLASLPRETTEQVLARIDAKESQKMRRLLSYGDETAGGIMQAEFLAVPQDATISDAIQRVRSGKGLDHASTVFVVNPRKQVVGQLSLSSLILADAHEPVSRIMDTDLNPIPVDMDQEEVARIFQKYDIILAPVVEADGTLVGCITVDDVVDIMQEEVSEDILRMGGTDKNELVYGDRVWKISRLRLPWLLTNLLGGLVTGYLLWLFKVALAEAIVLVTFVPVITGMGGNVGIQSSTITIRGLATGDVDFQRLGRTLFKELRVGLLMATACGLTLGVVAEVWHQNPALGITVGCAMAAAILVASFMGTVVPIIFKRLGIDPAVAAGPFVTTANDISGILIYLTVATAFLKYIVH